MAIIKCSISSLHYTQTVRLIQSLVLLELGPSYKETTAVSNRTQTNTGTSNILLKQRIPDGHIALSIDLEDGLFVSLIRDEVGILYDRLILVSECHDPHVCLRRVVRKLSVFYQCLISKDGVIYSYSVGGIAIKERV